MAHCRGIRITVPRGALIPVLSGSLAGILLAGTVHAAIFDLKDETYPPETFGDVEQSVNALESYIDDAQCGGWKMNESVAGKISTVSGVPGRRGDPLALIGLGMAKREEEGGLLNDGYRFPDIGEVRGWTSACSGVPPYYSGGGQPCKDPQTCQQLCVDLNRWQYPKWRCVNEETDSSTGVTRPITTYPTGDPREHTGNDPRKPEPPPPPVTCNKSLTFVGWFYYCTGRIVTQMEYEKCDEGGSECFKHLDANRNCLRCEGDGAAVDPPQTPQVDSHGKILGRQPAGAFNETGCRVGRSPTTAQTTSTSDVEQKGPVLPDGEKRKSLKHGRYTSFYRHYTGASYSRGAITPEVPRDNNQESGIPVRCYGKYKEFDPRLQAAKSQDKHCVIDISRNEPLSIGKMRDSQKGTGKTSEDMGFLPAAFDKKPPEGEMTIWRNDLENDDTPDDVHLLEMPSKYQRATVQMTAEEPISSGSLIRAFDETIATDPLDAANTNHKRTLVEWWQEQQTEGNKIFTPPVLRVVVPPAWSVDLDPLQPLFVTKSAEEEMSEWKENTILQPMEIQLEIREDLLGEVAEFLEKSLLLQIEQERVPIAVPLGSATELRAMREGWCHWYKFQNKKESCDDADGDLKKLLDRLAEYADRIDDYRTLRAELSTYLAEYLQIHNRINENIGRWALDNMETFSAWQETRNAGISELKVEWERVQTAYRQFHDDTNFKWCRNDRFTIPIYSLLDPWMPGRPNLKNDALLANGAPDETKRLPTITGTLSPDLVFDLTRLHLATGAVKLPVLDPIQVSYNSDILRPPSDSNIDPPFPKLPELQPLPSIADQIEEDIPEVEVGENLPPMIQTPLWSIDIGGTKQQMIKIRNLIVRMDREYASFWDTLTKVTNSQELNCDRPNTGRCIHAEMDLIERFTRIGARPAVLLREDFQSIGKFRKPLECPKEDWACVLLNPQKTFAKAGWEVRYPLEEEQKRFLGDLRTEMIEKSLTKSINFQSPQAEVLVSFDSPVEIILLFTPPKVQ